jgi:hypothetical protein
MNEVVAYKVKRTRDGTISSAIFCNGTYHFEYDAEQTWGWDYEICDSTKCRSDKAELIDIDELKTLYTSFQEKLGLTISIPDGTVFLSHRELFYNSWDSVPVSEFENGILLNDGEYVVKTGIYKKGKYKADTYYGNHGGRAIRKYLGKVGSKRAQRRLNRLRGYGGVEIETTSYKAELYAIRTRKQALLRLPITPTVVKTLQLAEEAERFLLALPYEEIDMHADDIALSLSDEIQDIIGSVRERVDLRQIGREEADQVSNPILAIETDYTSDNEN